MWVARFELAGHPGAAREPHIFKRGKGFHVTPFGVIFWGAWAIS